MDSSSSSRWTLIAGDDDDGDDDHHLMSRLATDSVVGMNETAEDFDGNGTLSYDQFLLCHRPFPLPFNVIPCIICTLIFVFGLQLAFFGYRLLKATMFVSGFMFGSSIVYFVCVEESVLPLLGKLGVSLGAGLVCGLVAILILYAGLFMTGFECGLLFGLILFLIVEFFCHPFTKWIPIGTILGLGILFGILILRWQRSGAMLATSVVGSGLILLAADYFLDAFRMTEYCYDRLTARRSTVMLCWFSWLLLALWLPLSVFSLVLQWRVTASKYDHRLPADDKEKRRSQRRDRKGSESDPHHYRHIYRIRRMNGDVISTGYLKNIEVNPNDSSFQLLAQTTTGVDSIITGVQTDADVALTSVADPDDANIGVVEASVVR